MTWPVVADLLGLLFLLLGALLCVAAAIGLLRFPDLLSRMHAGTKPQVLGVIFVIVGVGLRTRSGIDVGMLVLIGVFQLLTIPAGAHMVGRAGFRTGQVEPADIHLGRRRTYGPPEPHAPQDQVGDSRDEVRDTQDRGRDGQDRARDS
jgi:multicomponent Na+:H+ antiporter subunit G